MEMVGVPFGFSLPHPSSISVLVMLYTRAQPWVPSWSLQSREGPRTPVATQSGAEPSCSVPLKTLCFPGCHEAIPGWAAPTPPHPTPHYPIPAVPI